MIIKNNKEIEHLESKGTIINTVRKGAIVVWEYIRSCFGKGFWVSVKGWNNSDGWRNR